MKFVRFIFALVLTIIFFSYFNFKNDEIPPLGKFLNPFVGFWQNGESDEIKLSGIIKSDKLKSIVKVQYDNEHIPHIFAENDYDVYFTQGYVTASDRLWQMDFQVLATEGRLSEVLGAKFGEKNILEFDRTQRRKGLKYAAIRSLEGAASDTKLMEVLQAYSDGVNAYIDELSYKDYPIEYKMLDYEPKYWSPYRSMLLLKYMADMLSSWEADFENSNAMTLFGIEDFELLFPDKYSANDPIIPSEKRWDFKAVAPLDRVKEYPKIRKSDLIEKVDEKHGSNNFVVGRSRTLNGSVILANETDLSLNLPSIWYIAQLSAPGMNVYGSSLPGAPGVITGFTDSIAWGVTNAKRDVVDWYQIEFRNDQRKEYKYDNMWLKTEAIVERIDVRDDEPFYDTIIHTHYGPVVYDRNFKGESERANFAMKWTAHEESKELMTFYLLNRGKNYEDFVNALEYHCAPAQNFAFGAVNGDIAMWVNGRFPVKWETQGKFIMNGSDSRFEWGEDIPHAHKAHILNPDQGFLSSANQHPVDSTYPYYTYDYNYEMYRNRRINDRLRYLESFSVKDAMKLQNDNYNYRASESLPTMLNTLDTTKLDANALKYYSQLRKWDYFSEPKIVTPTMYEEWWNQLYDLIWDEFDDQSVALKKPRVFNTIRLINTDSLNKYFDKKTTTKVETLKDLLDESFAGMVGTLEERKQQNKSLDWYSYKGSSVKHLLKLDPFSVNNVEVGGNKNIVNATSKSHGPSWRMIVELSADGVKAWGVYPGSQTGNPGHPGYAKYVTDWANGNYFKLNFLHGSEENNPNIIQTVIFK